MVALRTMLKHNVYFDGNVQSVGFARQGRNMQLPASCPPAVLA